MPRRLLLLAGLAAFATGCDEKSCAGGGGNAAAAKSFNASNLSAPEPAKLGKPGCRTGTCPLQEKAVKETGADRFVGAAPDSAGEIPSLERSASDLARKFDGAGTYEPPAVVAPTKSSRPGWVCDGNSCRRAP